MSVDMMNDEMTWALSSANLSPPPASELRRLLRERSVPESIVNSVLEAGIKKEELLTMSREMYDERLRTYLGSQQSQTLWAALHSNEKSQHDRDGHEMNDLRSFINNNSIQNNIAQEAEDENGSSKRGRAAKPALQVPQPRTTQSRQQQQQQQQQQQSNKSVEHRMILWLSGVSSSEVNQVLKEVGKYGKVVKHGVSQDKSDMMYFKLKDCKGDLSGMQKIGNYIVEECHRVPPGEAGDRTPPARGPRPEEAEEDGTNKLRAKPNEAASPYPQQQTRPTSARQQGPAGSQVDEHEEDGDLEDSRTHRKGMRNIRGRGRGANHGYHTHRHSEGTGQVMCRYFNKGGCKYGEQCPFQHPSKHPGRS